MSNTIIRFPRARSLTGQSVSTVLTNNNMTLPYGSPLTFTSTKYSSANNIGSNHLFCVGDGLQQPHTPILYHVGPYWSRSAGLSVNNDPSSDYLGDIRLSIVAGDNVSVTGNANNALVISSDPGILICHATYHTSATDYTLDVTKQQILDAVAAGKMVFCFLTNAKEYYALALAADLGTIHFQRLRQNTHITSYLSANNNETWSMISYDTLSDLYLDEWFTLTIPDTTTTYNITVEHSRKCIIIDNSENSADLDIYFTASVNSGLQSVTNVYINSSAPYGSIQGTMTKIEAGKIALLKARAIFPDSIYVEITEMENRPGSSH